jgi:hypothetical protein
VKSSKLAAGLLMAAGASFCIAPEVQAVELFGVPGQGLNADITQVEVHVHGGGVHAGGMHAGGYHGGGAYHGGGYGYHGGGVYHGGGYGYHGGGVYHGGGGGYAWRNYAWPVGGAIAAGAAIGFLGAASVAAWAPPPPQPGLCWYYTDASQRNGFWDACP